MSATTIDQLKRIACIVILDQGTKLAALLWLPSVVKNTGGSFGLFAQKNVFFLLLSIVILIILVGFMVQNRVQYQGNKWFRFGVALIIGGGIGNILDRVLRGYVVDFIKVPLWPSFNVADLCITLGVTLLLWYSFFEQDRNEIRNTKF